MTPHQFAQKVAALQACAPGVQWLEENGIVDFRTGWRRCEQADFMTWLAVRLLGIEAMRAPLVIAKTAVWTQNADAVGKEALIVSEAILDGRFTDLHHLQVLAFDAADLGTRAKDGQAPALAAASFCASAVAHAKKAQQAPDAAARHKALASAAKNGADCVNNAHAALTGHTKRLPEMVRQNIREDLLQRAFDAALQKIALPPG